MHMIPNSRPLHLTPSLYRLLDTLYYEARLYLVFEFLDNDLKRYQEIKNTACTPLSTDLIKVRLWLSNIRKNENSKLDIIRRGTKLLL